MSLPPLGYSSNLHAAETVDELLGTLTRFTSEVRKQLGWDRLGLDLRLGSTAIRNLARDQTSRAKLRRALDEAHISAHSLNAFPLRPFQAAVVKADAYRPDWTETERVDDTIAIIDVALALSDDDLITVSTVPGSYRPFGAKANDQQIIAAALGRWAGHAAQRARTCGRKVVLCLEPEPWCTLETSFDVTAFWRGPLAEFGIRAAAQVLDNDEKAAQKAIDSHLGICFDTCHFSLAFEDQHAAVQRMREAGVNIAKCQFSAAPEVLRPFDDTAGLAALRSLAEPRFMHQTAACSANGSLSKVQDLDQLDQCLARLPNATAVRSHFHIPIFRPAQADGLSSTINDSQKGLYACLNSGCTHVSVETYTWSILAEQERDALTGTVRELEYLRKLF
jgi:sugar phosphate isomerase/epimerase